VLERMREDRIASIAFTALQFRIYNCRKECVKILLLALLFSALHFIAVIGYHYLFRKLYGSVFVPIFWLVYPSAF
jgi:hypothetical protein